MRKRTLPPASYVWSDLSGGLNRKAKPGEVDLVFKPDGGVTIKVGCPHRVGACEDCMRIALRALTEAWLNTAAEAQRRKEQATNLARLARRRGR